jgi:hypothetical protein
MSKTKNTKKKYHDICASRVAYENYGTMYESLRTSGAFQSLTIGAQLFYADCRIQYMSNGGKACLHKHAQECGREYDEHCFVFPSSHLQRYGYDRSNASKYIKQLVAAGFIEIVENNKPRKKVNVYRFVETWKTQ